MKMKSQEETTIKLGATLMEKDKEIKKLKEENKKIQEDLDVYKEADTMMTSQIEDLEEEIKELKEQLEDDTRQVHTLFKENEELKIKADADHTATMIEKLNEELSQVQKEYKNVDVIVKEWITRLIDIFKDDKDYRLCSDEHDEIDVWEKLVKGNFDLNSNIKNFTNLVEKIIDDYESDKKELEGLGENYDNLEIEKDERIAELECMLENDGEAMEELEKDIQTTHEENGELKKENEKIKQLHSNMVKEMDEWKMKSVEVGLENDKLIEELKKASGYMKECISEIYKKHEWILTNKFGYKQVFNECFSEDPHIGHYKALLYNIIEEIIKEQARIIELEECNDKLQEENEELEEQKVERGKGQQHKYWVKCLNKADEKNIESWKDFWSDYPCFLLCIGDIKGWLKDFDDELYTDIEGIEILWEFNDYSDPYDHKIGFETLMRESDIPNPNYESSDEE